jgi:hypothetical protein
MSVTLNDYVFRTQRLLHDAQQQIWPVTPDLVLYCNLGRDRVALGTLATRILPVITLKISVDQYFYSQVQAAALTLATAPPTRGIGVILGINCIQSTAYQPPLKKMAWTELNLKYRTGGPTNNAAFPDAWADYGDYKTFYVENSPGTNIQAEIDCKYLPTYLINLTDVEMAIPDPWTELVPFVAAAWASYYQDDMDSAMKFMAHYKMYKNDLAEDLPPFSGYN